MRPLCWLLAGEELVAGLEAVEVVWFDAVHPDFLVHQGPSEDVGGMFCSAAMPGLTAVIPAF